MTAMPAERIDKLFALCYRPPKVEGDFPILIWKSKHADSYYDASTPEKAAASALKIFKIMDKQGDYECIPLTKDDKPLYTAAKKGNGKAALILLNSRSDYEYERVELDGVELVK